MIPAMIKKGYDKAYAAAVIASAGTIGVIIPPSIPMVLYAFVSGVSLGDLFMAGVIPGILVGISLMICSFFIALRRGYPTESSLSFGEVVRSFVACRHYSRRSSSSGASSRGSSRPRRPRSLPWCMPSW